MDKREYLESLKGEIPKLAIDRGGKLREDAFKEAKDFIDNSGENLVKWSTALAKGELSKDDFAWLLQSNKDLLKLNGLKEIGLTEIQAEKFRSDLFALVTDQTTRFLESQK